MNWWEQEEAEQQAYEAQMQAMYDEQQREQQTTEQLTWLQEEVARLKAENEVLRQERPAVVAWLREWADRVWHEDIKRAIAQEAYDIERGEHWSKEEA